MQSQQAAVSKQPSENQHLQSTWLFLSVHIYVGVYIYEKLQLYSKKALQLTKFKLQKKQKVIGWKFSFPTPLLQLLVSSPEASYFNVLHAFSDTV